ncbi:hypothetical protein MKW94_030333 [Papaver nudicaule]|uniref:Uncharacterized protein n=1 Tax=Papaver nudicaule TaxID=74823 RepID=A0AA41VYJ8_PAPNU|nr:hypothetical protein [Papaver nudicaule]
MPRSSRHKQHKLSKHSSKDARERSDSEDDVNLKTRDDRVFRDMASGEKRRHSQDDNVDFSEDYVASKRRKEGADSTADNSGRWKGVEEDRRRKEKIDSETVSKIRALVDSSSHKSSRRNESLKKENNAVIIENEEVQRTGSSKNEIKYKSEKDSRRKEVYEYKDGKDKGTDRERKVRDSKKEILIDAVPGRGSEDGESGRKRISQSLHAEEVRSRKREVEADEWRIHDDVRNPDLEKEYEKRIRRQRDDSVDKDKYQEDKSEGSNRYFSSKDDRTKSGPDKDERSGRDKSRDDRYRDKYREDINWDHRRDDKHRDDHSVRDHGDRSDTRHFRDDSKTEDNRYKSSRPHDSDPDGSSRIVEVGTRYKDVKETKRTPKENEGLNGIRSPNSVERRAEMEKKTSSSSRLSSVAERGRSQSRHLDVDFNVSTNKWNTSPSSNVHAVKDHRYNTKQAESKYRDSISEERVRTNIASSRDLTGPSGALERTSERISLDKPIQKDEKYVHEMSNERPRRPDAQPSPKLIIEKSPSSSSYDRRYPNRSTLRRSLDVEELGGRSIGAKDVRDHSANEERRSRDLPSEKPVVDDFSQPDGDTLSVTPSVNRSCHFTGNPSSSLLPPPPPSLRTVVSSPSVMEEDSRGKPNNSYRRYGDPNPGRGLVNAWKGLPSWPSPVTNGFIPYPHGPPPGGFHPLMQQFPAHFYGVRPTMDLNHAGLPYIPDADRFSSHGRSYVWRNPDGPFSPHLQGWDGSNRVLGDEAQMYGMPDWDQNRHPLSSRGWETSAELGKGQKNSVNMELPPAASRKEDHPQLIPSEEARSGPLDQQLQNDRPGASQEGNIEVKEFNVHAKNVSPEAPRIIHNVADEGAPQFCGAYLCKLDTSIDLCDPELYNNCISLLEEESASVTKEVKEHDYMEERVQSGVRISNAIKSASFFPKIDESIFQRALGLYRKQVDELKVTHHSTPMSKYVEDLAYEMEKLEQIPIAEEEKDPTAEGENLEHIPTTEEEELKLVSAMEEKVPESVSATKQVELEPVPCMKQEKLETVTTTENGELQPIPTTDLDKLEPISATVEGNLNLVTITEEEKPQPRVSCTTDEEMPELGSSFDFENLEPGVASDQDMIELHPTPELDKSEEHILNLNQENLEHQVLGPEQENLEVAIPVAGSESVDEISPTTFQDIMEEEPSTREQNMKEMPCTVVVKKEQEEPDATSTLETAGLILEKTKQEVVVSDRSSIHGQSSLATTEYPFIEEEITRARNCEGSHDPEEQKASTDANCGSPSLGFIAGSSEGCEALMPESIECRLVSLSRIHNFPENTH